MKPKAVTVFGGSEPKPGDPAYEEARLLGQRIAEAGFAVLTGGYVGTMEAVSRGANEAGGHVIGVTCGEIERWRPIRANRWVIEERKHTTLTDRINALIQDGDAAFALPGGIGTLTEIATMWTYLQTNRITRRPLILIGPGWQATFTAMFEGLSGYIRAEHRGLLTFADTVEEGMTRLRELTGG